MITTTHLLFLSALTLLLPHIALAKVDYCHADLRVRTDNQTCTPTSHILHVPYIGDNPNHALHDWIWAIAHYTITCAQKNMTVVINEPRANLSLCSATSAEIENASYPPHWGVCTTSITLQARGYNPVLFFSGGGWPYGSDNFSLPEGGDCVKRTWLGVPPPQVKGFNQKATSFRYLNWFGRECGPLKQPGGKKQCEGSGFVPLSDSQKRNALLSVRHAVRNFFNIKKRGQGQGGKVRVLVYNRNDTVRREWVNAHEVVNRLANDKRVEVRFAQSIPRAFRDQVELFTWADILVAPHGAAMANSIFMESGTEVIEVWKFCDMNVEYGRYRGKEWTGWHAWLTGLNLAYVQCHRAEQPYRKPHELINGKNGELTPGKHKVRPEEVMDLLEGSIARQISRLTKTNIVRRRGKSVSDSFKFEVRQWFDDGRARTVARISAVIAVPLSVAVIMMRWRLAGRRALPGAVRK